MKASNNFIPCTDIRTLSFIFPFPPYIFFSWLAASRMVSKPYNCSTSAKPNPYKHGIRHTYTLYTCRNERCFFNFYDLHINQNTLRYHTVMVQPAPINCHIIKQMVAVIILIVFLGFFIYVKGKLSYHF